MSPRSNKNIYSTLGASNHSDKEREANDLYCTHPDAVHELVRIENLSHTILEPCAGLGHIADALRLHGHEVVESDLLSRGRDIVERDVFTLSEPICCDVVTNPPYSAATAIIRHLLALLAPGTKMAMWLRILYLESAERKRLFADFPPARVWISSRRIPCGRNGVFGASAQGFAWFVWQSGYQGETILKWF